MNEQARSQAKIDNAAHILYAMANSIHINQVRSHIEGFHNNQPVTASPRHPPQPTASVHNGRFQLERENAIPSFQNRPPPYYVPPNIFGQNYALSNPFARGIPGHSGQPAINHCVPPDQHNLAQARQPTQAFNTSRSAGQPGNNGNDRAAGRAQTGSDDGGLQWITVVPSVITSVRGHESVRLDERWA